MSAEADSARQEFKTRNGRIVYEGRGIDPDVSLPKEELNLVEISLLRQGMYFDFATEFESRRDSFDAAELPDEVFREFQTFLEEQNFDYKTDSEKLLEELETELEGIDEAGGQIQSLRTSIQKEKEIQFNEAEERIRKTLFLELVSRYQGQSGRIEANLKSDPQVLEGIEYINAPDRVEKLLSGR